jgi:hypothetical protein
VVKLARWVEIFAFGMLEIFSGAFTIYMDAALPQ